MWRNQETRVLSAGAGYTSRYENVIPADTARAVRGSGKRIPRFFVFYGNKCGKA
ncbi:MAG: hypothetical protein QXS68_07135 [Candidatus Methanomethylicaceae archaeon]